jgi:hypothetical protein
VLAVLCFAIVIHLGAKKFDRYLLPIFAPLDLVAGMGWAALARWLSDLRFSRLWRFSGPLALCAAIVLQLFGTMRTYPYYLSYYNPLLGGNTGAQRDMMIGWGEGLDQAARYLNRRPNADQLHVVSWYAPGCFSYFFQGASTAIPGKGFADPSLQDVLNADYVVTYSTHQAQRQTPAALLDYLYRQEPEHTVYINGIEYVRVYGTHDDGGNGPEYEVAGAVLGDEIELESYQISDRDLAAGQTLVVSLSWQALEALHEPCKVFVHLLDSSGKLVAQHDGEPVAWHSPTDRWSAGEQLTDRHGIPLPEDLSPGEYSLVAGMYRHSGERLPISQRGEPVGMRTNWVR